jgi:hypothetical protein
MSPERGTKKPAPECPAHDEENAATKQTDTSSQTSQSHLERPGASTMPDPEDVVDQLFTGPPLPGRNWSCEVKKFPDPSTKGERAHFWLVDGDTERWFGTVALFAQVDMAAAAHIALDVAHSANRLPVPVQVMSKAKAPQNLVPSRVARLILQFATKRQAPGRDIFLAPTFHAEEDGYYIKWSASCIDRVGSRPWTFKGVISLCSATQACTTSEPYISNLQFITKEGRLLSVRQENGHDVHESIVPDQVPDISKPWTSQADKRVAILQAEQLARVLTAKLDGMEINKASAEALAQHYSEKYGSASPQTANGTVFGLHGGLKLYDIQRDVDQKCYRLSPSGHVRKHIDPRPKPLPDVVLKSLDRDRLVLVLDAMIESWLMTGSFTDAAFECAKAADAATRAASEGTPPQYMGRVIQFEPRLQVLQDQLALLGID